MKRLLFLIVVLISINSFAQKRDTNFDKFWTSFRTAALSYNLTALDTLVAYPVSTRGPMDYDPVIKVARNKFIAVLKQYMAEDGGVGDGTHQQEIQNKTSISTSDYSNVSSGTMRIGDMQFKKVGGKWKLYWLYLLETD